ncbi:MAG: restriction endonuclease subunit S [Gemmatimonadaceae bacterium]|nr:restriction endonuclease subunit S [Gemmatimonadaceae bacterium]
MLGEWEVTTLGAEVELLTGFPFRSNRYTDADNGIRLVRGDNIVQGAMRWDGVKKWPCADIAAHSMFLLREGDVVLAMDRPWIEAGLKFAAISRFDLPCLLVQRTARLRGGPNLDTGFLRYLVGSREFTQHIHAITTGTAVPHISGSQIKAFAFSRPPLNVQRSIAAVLGALDEKIELNRRMNATLEAMARALFQSWFVDFDPVRAKLERRPPLGLDLESTAVFPSRFVESPLGQIPRGWETGAILKQADLLSGGTPKTDVPAYWNGDVPWVSAKDVSQCGEAFLTSTDRTITERGVQESSTKIIPAYATVVVARGATTGRLTMLGHAMAMNQTCYGLYSKVGSPFALHCSAQHFMERLVKGGHGSIFDTITTSTFEATDVLLPPADVLLAFERRVSPWFMKVHANLHQSRTLAELRDTLLPKLLSGELRVADAERLVISHS